MESYTAAVCVMHRDAPTCTAAWKSFLPPDEVLQHRALPSTLPADHSDLRQVQVRILSNGGESILHAVHQRNQILHSPVPHLCGAIDSVSFLVKTGRDLYLLFLFCPSSPPSRSEGVFKNFFYVLSHFSVCSLIDCSSLVCQITSDTTLSSTEHRKGRMRMISCISSGKLPAVSNTHRWLVTLVYFPYTALKCADNREFRFFLRLLSLIFVWMHLERCRLEMWDSYI